MLFPARASVVPSEYILTTAVEVASRDTVGVVSSSVTACKESPVSDDLVWSRTISPLKEQNRFTFTAQLG